MTRGRVGCCSCLVVLALPGHGLAAGTVPLSPAEVWRGALAVPAAPARIVRELRAPRVLLAFLVGGSLAVCGAALQAMIRNPLAEPYLLGPLGRRGPRRRHSPSPPGGRAMGGAARGLRGRRWPPWRWSTA